MLSKIKYRFEIQYKFITKCFQVQRFGNRNSKLEFIFTVSD